MIGFTRRVGPPPPSRIGAMWRAVVVGPAPVRLWAQVIGFGTVVWLIVHTMHRIIDVIVSGGTPLEISKILANGLIGTLYGLAFIALAQVVAITELKVGFNASKDGLHADLERDDDKPAQTVEATATVTVKPAGDA